MPAHLGWWQQAVAKPPRLARSWEAACRVARVLLTQIHSPDKGGWDQVLRHVPLRQEPGKSGLARGWRGSAWCRQSPVACCLEHSMWELSQGTPNLNGGVLRFHAGLEWGSG